MTVRRRWLLFSLIWIGSIALSFRLRGDWFALIFWIMFTGALAIHSWSIRGRLPNYLKNIRQRTFDHRRLVIVSSTFLSLYFLVQSAENLEPGATSAQVRFAALYLMWGGLILGIAIAFSPKFISHPDVALSQPQNIQWVLVGLGGLILTLMTITTISTHLQVVLLVGGICILVWGFRGEKHVWTRIAGREMLVVTLITLFGLIVRVWDLEEALHRFLDEIIFANEAASYRYDSNVSLVRTGAYSFPNIFTYFQAGTIALWGKTLTGVRMVSVLFGTLTIPALYLLCRGLFDRKTALISAILLAAFPPHIQLSRLGLNNIVDPFFGTLAFACFAQGLKNNQRLYFALSGAALGLTQYFYEGGRLLFPVVFVLWVLGEWIQLHRSFRGSLVTMFVGAVVAAPIYYTLHVHDLPLTSRLDSQAQNKVEPLAVVSTSESYLEHLKSSFLAYTTKPEPHTIYYGGQYGFVLPLLLPMFLFGICWLVWHLHSLPLVWIVGAAIGTSLLEHNILSTRYTVVFPAVVLVSAVGIRYIAELLLPQKERFQNVGLAILVGFLAYYQVDYYFREHLPRLNDQVRLIHAYDGEDALFRARDFPPNTVVHLISSSTIAQFDGELMLEFIAPRLVLDVRPPESLSTTWVAALPCNVDHAFFIEDQYGEVFRLLDVHFDLGTPRLSPYKTVPHEKQFLLFYSHTRCS